MKLRRKEGNTGPIANEYKPGLLVPLVHVNHLHSSKKENLIVYMANASNQRRQGSGTKSMSASNKHLPGQKFQLLAFALKR